MKDMEKPVDYSKLKARECAGDKEGKKCAINK